MNYTLYDLLLSYLFPVFQILLSILGIYAARLLMGRTRNKGPVLLLIASSAYILLSIIGILFRTIFSLRVDSDTTMFFWMGSSSGYMVAMGLFFFAILLIAQDFRSFLETKKIQDSLHQPPHQS